MEDVEPQGERSMIERIRNMWEFANLAQWIYIFGKAVKIDEDLDIEVREPSTFNQFRIFESATLTGTHSGSGNGVYEESFNSARRHWPCTTQICLLT